MFLEEQITVGLFPGLHVQHFFMMSNYEDETVALYIARTEEEPPLTEDDPGSIVTNAVAENAGLPFFLIRYNDVLTHVTPVNRRAHDILPEAVSLDRDGWIRFVEKCMASYARLQSR